MQIYTCNTGNVNQRFSVTSDQRIALTNHGECLDLTEGDLTNGNRVSDSFCPDGAYFKLSTGPDVEMHRWKCESGLGYRLSQQLIIAILRRTF